MPPAKHWLSKRRGCQHCFEPHKWLIHFSVKASCSLWKAICGNNNHVEKNPGPSEFIKLSSDKYDWHVWVQWCTELFNVCLTKLYIQGIR